MTVAVKKRRLFYCRCKKNEQDLSKVYFRLCCKKVVAARKNLASQPLFLLFFRAYSGIFWRKKQVFQRNFEENSGRIKRVYKILCFTTKPSVSRKNVKKVAKKVLTLDGVRGIIYKSTRYGNKTKAKIARHWQREIA